MLECVIFDFDGLLVDSEPLQYRAYRAAFARHGVNIDESDWRRWLDAEASVAAWIELDGLAVGVDEVRAEKKVIYEAMVAEELTLKPGARELVDGLVADHRLCVASGSRVESIEACLGRFALRGHFDAVFSATAVARSKPYPDVYLYALEAMDVAAGGTLAIEDSEVGLSAATAAGIRCVVCPDTSSRRAGTDYAAAILKVESLLELDAERLTGLIEPRTRRAP